MNFEQFLNQLLNVSNPDISNWLQIGRLTKEEEITKRSLSAKALAAKREADMLNSKIAVLAHQVKADTDEWWFNLYKQHGLPDGNYHILEDGRIFMEPKEKQGK